MTDFNKARDEAAVNYSVDRTHMGWQLYGFNHFNGGADWAYQWFTNKYNYKIACDRKKELELQQAIIDRLKEGLEHYAAKTTPEWLCIRQAKQALADVKKMEEG